jgi:hypothetical protein
MATNKDASFTVAAATTPEKPTISSFSAASSPDLSPTAIAKATAANAMIQEQNKTKDASTNNNDKNHKHQHQALTTRGQQLLAATGQDFEETIGKQ